MSILPLKLTDGTVLKRGKTVLNKVSLRLEDPGFSVVMGPNGAGKTTLLRLLHGLERLSSGKIDWNVSEREARDRQAFVFQTPTVLRRTVAENIAYPLLVKGFSKEEAVARAEASAKRVGLENLFNTSATFLSGGERQKLSIARALIVEPELLFLDEPTTNLDGASVRDIEAVLISARQNGTKIIMATHDLGQARRLSTDVIFLNHGALCEASKASEFFEGPKNTAARAYLNGEIVE